MKLGLREILFILLLLALPVAAYQFVFQPRNDQISRVREQIDQKRQKLEQLQEATRRIDDLGQEIDRLSEAVTLFEQKLPAEREVEVVLKEVWELATAHTLVPKSIRTDDPVDMHMYAELPLKMEIIGDFDGFYSFMLAMERLRRITRLPRLKVESIDRGYEGKIKAEMVLSIFYEAKDSGSTSDRVAEGK